MITVVVFFPLLLLACYYVCPSTAIKSKLLLDLRGVLLACISSYVIVEELVLLMKVSLRGTFPLLTPLSGAA